MRFVCINVDTFKVPGSQLRLVLDYARFSTTLELTGGILT